MNALYLKLKKTIESLDLEFRQVFLFILVGGASTVLNYAIFWLFLDLLHWHYIIAACIGYVSGVFFGYYLNARHTFQFKGSLGGVKPVVYFSTYIVSLILSSSTLYLLVNFLHLNPKIANILAIGQSTVTNFLGCKFIVFRRNLKS